MPEASPLHPRTAALCTSLRWKEWAGYHAVARYDTVLEPEYAAFRHAAGLMDVTPLQKVDVRGPDAAELLAWVWTRDARRVRVGQVVYGCWCDARGKVLDDGTLTRWDDDRFRMTSADPFYGWLVRQAEGFDVTVTDETRDVAALALQGPRSRDVLVGAGLAAAEDLRFFRAARGHVGRAPVELTRTGYSGDLGYELWIRAEHALEVWDALVEAGGPHGLRPVGLDALDVVRLEAGFVMGHVDFRPARTCLVPEQTSTPYELDLGWAVHLEREPFIGQDALRREAAEGPRWALVGLEVDWDDFERLHAEKGLPAHLAPGVCRAPAPVYDGVVQVGQATSSGWSPTQKRSLALATVRADRAALGTRLDLEVTVEFERRRAGATVVPRPFFDPERKRA